MRTPFVISVLCGLVWGIWPIMTKVSKTSPSIISFFVCLMTFLVVSTWLYYTQQINTASIKATPMTGMGLVMGAGVLNAIGMILYGVLLSSQSGFDASKYIPITSALIPVCSILGAWLILKEPINLQKWIGIILICAGVFFLNKK